MNTQFLLFLLCGVHLLCDNAIASRLKLPRILLPIFKTMSVNFTLEVQGSGCFQWSCSRPDLVSIVTEGFNQDENCSSKVRLTVLTHDHTRQTAVLLAKDIYTDELIRADITLDTIAALKIETTVREIYMEEAPVMFEVRAYDEQGNRFTSLEGIEFNWMLHHSLKDMRPVLRFITFRESPYDIPQTVASLDGQGRKGHIVLLEGIRTGSSKVSVQLPFVEYERLPKVEVNLTVIENLILTPTEAVILMGDKIEYKLAQVRQGVLVNMDLLSTDRYSLRCAEGTIVSISGNVVTGLRFGVVKIMLVDENSLELKSSELPTAHLRVAEPFYMTLNLHPYNNWILLSQQFGNITAELYDKENHKFYLGRNSKIDITFSKSTFHVIKTTKNGAHVYGYGNEPNSGEVVATLIPPSSSRDQGSSIYVEHKRLKANAILQVFSKLSVIPPVSYIPWHPSIPRYKVQYKASGGDLSYEWSSLNTSVAEISQSGLVSVMGSGQTTIRVCPKWDYHCFGKAEGILHSLVPSSIEIIPHIHESEINSPIFLNIALYGLVQYEGRLEKIKLSHCNSLEFSVTADDGLFFNKTLKKEPISDACGVVALIGSKPLTSKVSVSYFNGFTQLVAVTSVSVYKALSPKYPIAGVDVVLALGSSRQVVFSDGPYSTVGRITSEVNVDSSIIKFEPLKVKQPLYVFTVTCIKLGNTLFNLTVKSKSVLPQCLGVEEMAQINIICDYPSYIGLEPEINDNCPSRSIDKSIATKGSSVKLNVIVKDALGREFDNATSLLFSWTLDKHDLAFFDANDNVYLSEIEHNSFTLPGQHYKVLHLKNKTGDLEVFSKAVGYRSVVLEKLGISLAWLESIGLQKPKPLEITHSVAVVDDIVVEPSVISIINHPFTTASLLVSNGSGHYEIKIFPQSIVSAHFDRQIITVIPKEDGEGVLSITDTCVSTKPLLVSIHVHKVGKLKATMVDKVKLGDTFSAVVGLYGVDNRQLPFPTLDEEQLDLAANFGNPSLLSIVSIEPSPDKSKGSAVFKFKADALGETTIVFKCLDATSESLVVQVFHPLRIEPHSITMTLGSEVQISVIGGPQPDPGIQFSVGDSYSISVTPSGVVKGLHLGRSSVTAMSVGHLGEVYSKDSIEVNVVGLTGVRIISPIGRLGVGNVMPLWVSAIPSSISPFILGTIAPSLVFKWSVSLPSVVQIKDVLCSTNIEVKNEDKLSIRLVGLKPGLTQVSVSVSGRNPDKSVFIHNSTIDIEVFDHLKWVNPSDNSVPLLVPPKSNFQLRTNAEENVRYSVLNLESIVDRSEETSKESHHLRLDMVSPLIEVSDTGLVMVGSKLGSSIVLAHNVDKYQKSRSISLEVSVREVQYIMVNVLNVMNYKDRTHSLPQGLVLDMNVSYHDRDGSIFHVAPTQINVKANIFDKVHSHQNVDNEFSLSLERSGSITLRIADSVTNLEDFLKISVENHVSPRQAYLAEGAVVCFNMDSISDEGYWSSDGKVVEIDDFGMAKANKIGTAVISFKLDKRYSNIASTRIIEVLPIQMLYLGPLKSLIVTNSEINSEFFIPVQLLNERQKKDQTSSQPCHSSSTLLTPPPFYCEIRYNNILPSIRIEKIFTIKPSFCKIMGMFGCEITVADGPSFNNSQIESNITIRAVHNGSLSLTDSVVLTFLPSIFIPTSRLYFSPNRRAINLFVAGTSAVLHQITVETNTNLISVGKPKTTDQGVSYMIMVDNFFSDTPRKHVTYFITVRSPATHQSIQIPMYIGDQMEFGSLHVNDESGGQWNAQALMSVIFSPATAVVIFTILIMSLSKSYIFPTQFPSNARSPLNRPPRLTQLLEESLYVPQGLRESPFSSDPMGSSPISNSRRSHYSHKRSCAINDD